MAQNVYIVAIGTILGACVLLGKIAIGDWLTAVILVVSLGLLFRFKVNNPALVAVCAAIGVVAFPLLKPTVPKRKPKNFQPRRPPPSRKLKRIMILFCNMPNQRQHC